jgi:hypothetical protein
VATESSLLVLMSAAAGVLTHDLFEADRRKVVTLVYDHVPVIRNEILHLTLSLDALEKRDVNIPVVADLPDAT